MLTQRNPAIVDTYVRPASYAGAADLDQLALALTERLVGQPHLPRVTLDIGLLGKHTTGWSPGGGDRELVLPVRLVRSSVLCGPFYKPASGHGPCPNCLEQRWRVARRPEEQMALANADQAVTVGGSPWLTPFALDALGSLLASMIERADALLPRARLAATLYELHLDTLQVTRHELLADSLCPVCAAIAPDSAERAEICLQPRPKRSPSSYRLTSPLDYPLPMGGFLNPVCGTFGPRTFPDYTGTVTAPVSGSFLVENRHRPFEAWWGGHSFSYRRSERVGVLEALERFAGLRPRGKHVTLYESYANLGDQALNPLECGVYEPSFYAARPHVQPFTPDRKLYWAWGYSFRRQRPILVPEELVYYLEVREGVAHFVTESSNGCATGSTIEESILYGLLELIERDGFLMMWYARLAPPQIDPASCRHPDTLHMLNRLDRLGYDLHLFDTRMDIPVPSVTAVARRRDDGLGNVLLAAGASLDPEEAIRAAVCEIGSTVAGFASRTEYRLDELRAMARDYSRVRLIEDHAPLYGLPEMRAETDFIYRNPIVEPVAVRYADWLERWPRNTDLRDDVQGVIDILLGLGFDVITVDQSAPEAAAAGITVTCSIVPGLLPIEFGYDRRRYRELPRLRTVPYTTGYLAREFDPADANLTPHPFP